MRLVKKIETIIFWICIFIITLLFGIHQAHALNFNNDNIKIYDITGEEGGMLATTLEPGVTIHFPFTDIIRVIYEIDLGTFYIYDITTDPTNSFSLIENGSLASVLKIFDDAKVEAPFRYNFY